ncbi:MAG: hypothetical protein LBL96_09245 [Clostridiales bacterium]|jgi:hypothetical protein|nr:hypothetical protein [Clostridiales bacterium]
MNEKGFTLLDALTATLIFSIMIIPVTLTARSVSANFARAVASYETEQYLTVVLADSLANLDTAGYSPTIADRYECVIIVSRPHGIERLMVSPSGSDFFIQPALIDGADYFRIITCGLRDTVTGVVKVQAALLF